MDRRRQGFDRRPMASSGGSGFASKRFTAKPFAAPKVPSLVAKRSSGFGNAKRFSVK